MSHKKKAPKYFTQTKEHCRINKVIEAILLAIADNYITFDEFELVYKAVRKQCKSKA
jgi:hypothetical protein